MFNLTIKGKKYKFNKEKKLEDIKNEINIKNKEHIVAAIVNNEVKDLSDYPAKEASISFLDLEDVLGNRIYRRSLLFLMAYSIYKLFPDKKLNVLHSLGNGLYCEFKNNEPFNREELEQLQTKMEEVVKKDLPIIKETKNVPETIEIFKEQGFYDKIELINQLPEKKYTLYKIDDYYNYFYYNLVPHTGLLANFKLHYSYPGFVLLFPERQNPDKLPEFTEHPKLGRVFLNYEKFGENIGVSQASELNKKIKSGKVDEVIQIAEALHEKNIARIADEIDENINDKRVILIAGPSSSGKTTFSHRLAIQLKINGLLPARISLDDYFLNRADTPRDEEGNYNFEDLDALDLDLLNDHLIKLLIGEKVEIPTYNFHKGEREYNGKFYQLREDQPIILEGIHGLNSELTAVIPDEHKFKVYVSALTQINLDLHNRIPTTDTRKLRRIIRDYKYREHAVEDTLRIWNSVRKGEDKNIFPYQEKADIMFNSALIYELPVLKSQAIPLLKKVKKSHDLYYEAQRLIEILNCFKSVKPDSIPLNSILREFIGFSVFRNK